MVTYATSELHWTLKPGYCNLHLNYTKHLNLDTVTYIILNYTEDLRKETKSLPLSGTVLLLFPFHARFQWTSCHAHIANHSSRLGMSHYRCQEHNQEQKQIATYELLMNDDGGGGSLGTIMSIPKSSTRLTTKKKSTKQKMRKARFPWHGRTAENTFTKWMKVHPHQEKGSAITHGRSATCTSPSSSS